MFCAKCEEFSLYSWPGHEPKGASAKVEGEKLVFTLTGRELVRQAFRNPPHLVTFRTVFSHLPAGKPESWRSEETQTVIVNCRASDSTGYSRRRCKVPTNAQLATSGIDSTAPRRVRVVAVTYDGGSLVRNLDVRIRSEDRKEPVVTKSTGAQGYFLTMQPPRDSVTIDGLCAGATGDQRPVSGQLALYIAPGRDTTLQLVVDPRRCSR